MPKSILQEVLGVSDPANVEVSLNEAHLTLTGRPYTPSLADEFGIPFQELSRDGQERTLDIRTVGNLLLQDEVYSTTNTLFDWPIYQRLINAYGQKGDGTARALMIGALTPLSARSFECLATDVYGSGSVYVVDPAATEDKARHGKFIQGDGLRLPVASESLDFVHTNQLIHQLYDPSSPDSPLLQTLPRLFDEVVRVLKPDGQLLMKERTPGLESDMDWDYIKLQTLDFANFIGSCLPLKNISKGMVFLNRKPTDQSWLYDPERDFSKLEYENHPSSLNIYIRK